MADENIDITIRVDTGDASAELDQVQTKSADAGEALDRLDGKTVAVDVDVDTSNADRAKKSIDGIGTSADQTGSVVANMAGNATQDLADIAGAGGIAGQAMGQFAEYAAEGNISLKELGKAAPAVAGIATVMFALSQRAKNAADRLREISEATEELSRVSDAQVLEELGRAMANNVLTGTPLNELFKQMAVDNLPGFKRALDLATTSGQGTELTLGLMKDAIADVETEMLQQELTSKTYGTSLDSVAAGADVAAAALPALIDPLGNVEGAMAGAALATEDLVAATEILLGRINDRQAWLNTQDAIEDYVRALGNSELSSRDQERAVLAAKEALLRYIETLGNVPPEVQAVVTTALDQDDIGRAYAALDDLTKSRTVTVNLALGTISGALAGALAGGNRRGTSTETAGPALQSANVTNYYPPRLSPTEQYRAQRTYTRVQG